MNKEIKSYINTSLKYKKYNFNEVRKELNNEQNNNINNYISNNYRNLLKYNSFRNFQNNFSFHNNLNNELEKNKLKLENERLLKENMLIKKELYEALNQINKMKEQSLMIDNTNIKNTELNEQLSLFNNQIAVNEISFERAKKLYEKQINSYIQQLSNYNTLITLVDSFFQSISKKYIPNYSFNLPNIIVDPNNFVPLSKNDFEAKFNKIEEYINNLNQELNCYRLQNKNDSNENSNNKNKISINDFIVDKNDEEQKNLDDSNNSFYIKTNNIFENEIIAQKIRANSTKKVKGKLSKKKLNISKLNAKKEKSKNMRNNIKRSNLEALKNNKNFYKTFKSSSNLQIRSKKYFKK